MLAEGTSDFGRAVAVAFRSPLAIGPARFHHATLPTEADTVYLGAMSKSTWDSLGGMRALPSRVAEDADFYYRLRKAGGRVLVDPAIVSTYRPRETISDLWRQFYRYGLGKADMLYVNGEFPSWRPFAPLALILGLAVGLALLALGEARLLYNRPGRLAGRPRHSQPPQPPGPRRHRRDAHLIRLWTGSGPLPPARCRAVAGAVSLDESRPCWSAEKWVPGLAFGP